MEHIGTLPETNDVLSPTILFGILCPPAEEEEECHFCLEKITKGQFLVLKLPCCGHYTHTECFKTWASTSHTESTVRWEYCRIHRKTQLYNVLPHKSSFRMHNRPHSLTLASNLRLLWVHVYTINLNIILLNSVKDQNTYIP